MGTNTGTSRSVSGDTARARLAQRLRELRRASGLSLRDLERKVHASDSSLSRYLAGRALPPWQVVVVLCELTGADPDELRDLWERAWRPAEAADAGETDTGEPTVATTSRCTYPPTAATHPAPTTSSTRASTARTSSARTPS
ncbi:helix-turn-helix domain-containing protein [Actinophytocola sp.]|uniref:helix-turn-helix domain-containing protein n=1 Tax=Actinophytocola sp. TaxID=1872138 RepID=UPI00389A66ED